MHNESLTLMQWMFNTYIPVKHQKEKSVIDVGSFDHNGTYKHICGGFASYEGCDIEEGPNVNHVITQKGDWKSEIGKQFDVVISGQCLEHTRMPWVWIKQVKSLMKPHGWLLLVVPYAWPIHRYPVDCWRVLPDGMEALLEWAKLVPKAIGTLAHTNGNGDCFAVVRKGAKSGVRDTRRVQITQQVVLRYEEL